MLETRQDFNKKLITEILNPIIDKNPNLRFTQILNILGLNTDKFDEESSVTYQNAYNSYIEHFEEQIICEKKNNIAKNLILAKQMLENENNNKERDTNIQSGDSTSIQQMLGTIVNSLSSITNKLDRIIYKQ